MTTVELLRIYLQGKIGEQETAYKLYKEDPAFEVGRDGALIQIRATKAAYEGVLAKIERLEANKDLTKTNR